ncbi:MAG: FprA family A-type flavoprotein [Thermoanaerobacteraceae bacterium]|nr:FprA family A-type flavoprotein [Thermoanaerobacteraceae bacterium]
MAVEKVADGVYWVGAIDWDIRYFHGPAYSTHRGTSCNSYLIMDDKITLVDTVYTPFADEMIAHIKELVDPAKIDYVVVNHTEVDHSGAFTKIMEIAKNAKVFCTEKAVEGLKKQFFGDWDLNVVKTGFELNTGKKTLTFIEAPMLH